MAKERDGVRRALAERQAELARHLAHDDAPPPAGFDEQRLDAARSALRYKKQLERERERSLARPSFFARLWRFIRG